jgi:cytochrome c-type biogenesis protein CcmF
LILLLLFVTFFALYGNGLVLWQIGRGNLRLAGGALAHIGFMVMMLGIIASSSFNNPLAGETDQRENFVLTLGETRNVEGYQVSYRGKDYTAEGRPQYVIDFVDPRGRSFTMKPVTYKSNKEQWIQHPDIQMYFERDIFVAVSPNAMFDSAQQGDEKGGALTLGRNESRVLGSNEYQLEFVSFNVNVESDMVPDSASIAVGATLNLTRIDTGETRELQPIYIVMPDGRQQFVQNRVGEWGLTITFSGMNVNTGSANFVVEGVDLEPEDWVLIQAYEKPLINLVWIGIILLSCGFIVSIVRRVKDHRFAEHRAAAA